MASTYTTLNDATVLDAVVSALKDDLVPVNAFSTATDLGQKAVNDSVVVPVIGTYTATARTAGSTVTASGADAGTSVTLDQFYAAKWTVADGQIPQHLVATTFAQRAVNATHAVAKSVLDAAVALIIGSNYGTADGDKLVTAAADFGMSDLGLLYQKAKVKNLGAELALVLNAAYAGQLLGNSTLGLILATKGSDALMSGQVPPLMGMQTFVYPNMGTTENLGGFVCDKSAIAVAMAAPSRATSGLSGDLEYYEIATDPDGSVVLEYKRWYDADTGVMAGQVSALYGVAKINNALVRLLSA
jgi:hypothetical protein